MEIMMEIAEEHNSGKQKDDVETDDENQCKSAAGAYTTELLVSFTM